MPSVLIRSELVVAARDLRIARASLIVQTARDRESPEGSVSIRMFTYRVLRWSGSSFAPWRSSYEMSVKPQSSGSCYPLVENPHVSAVD